MWRSVAHFPLRHVLGAIRVCWASFLNTWGDVKAGYVVDHRCGLWTLSAPFEGREPTRALISWAAKSS